MPTFSTSIAGPPGVAINPLLDLASVDHSIQQTQGNALTLEGQGLQNQAARMANDYTAQTQPSQINLLLQSIGGLSPQGAGSSSAPSEPQASGGWQMPSGHVSLLSGDTPVSADAQTQQLVGQTASQLGVNPDWAMRIQHAESGGSARANSARSPAGAIGTMQLMPATAATLKNPDGSTVDPTDPQQNINGGVAYLAQMKQQFGNPVLATAAYNAGPGRVQDFLSGKQSLPAETVAYVGKVFGNGDGASLLHDALTGAHGPMPGLQTASATNTNGMPQTASDVSGMGASPPANPGLQPVPQDDTARAAVRGLVAQQRYYMAMPKGAGVRASAAIQAQLDNIAGPGGVVDPNTGNVFRVPGSFATRYAASQATEAGKAGPAAALNAQNQAVNSAYAQQTHAANSAVDTAAAANRPVTLSPGQTITTPGTVGVGSAAQPAPQGQQPGANAPPPTGSAGGIYQTPGDPNVQSAAKEGDRSVEIQQPIMDQAKESQNALNRIGQIRASMAQATANGLPPGYFSPELAQAAAAAKSLGIDLSPLGINPAAIQNEQVAREALTQVNGEILKRMFPQRITNADVTTFGSNLANYGMDPAALGPILNQAEQAAHYDVNKANDMHAYKGSHNQSLVGWESQFYPKNGYGPDLFDAVKSKTVPAAGGSTASAPSSAPAPTNAPAAPTASPLPMVSQGGRMVPDNTQLRDGVVYRMPNGVSGRFDGKRQGFVPVGP